MSAPITVTGLAVTPVKSLRVQAVESVQIGPDGAVDNRRFLVIDERDRLLNGKTCGELQTVVGAFSGGELALRFPDGRVVSAGVAHGEIVEFRFFSQPRAAHLLDGPWSEALSDYLGRPVRVVEPAQAGSDRGVEGGVSVVSRASLARLAAEAGADDVDARRFRMLVEIDGVDAHAEDAWVGRRVRIGSAVVAFHGHVGRCLTTTRDPETGESTLPTLDLLRDYRGELDSTEPLPFGIYGEVVTPGAVRIGDAVEVV